MSDAAREKRDVEEDESSSDESGSSGSEESSDEEEESEDEEDGSSSGSDEESGSDDDESESESESEEEEDLGPSIAERVGDRLVAAQQYLVKSGVLKKVRTAVHWGIVPAVVLYGYKSPPKQLQPSIWGLVPGQ